jgi:hypothetical protein
MAVMSVVVIVPVGLLFVRLPVGRSGQSGALDPDQVGDGGRRDGMPAGARLPNVQRDTGRAAALFSWWRGPR